MVSEAPFIEYQMLSTKLMLNQASIAYESLDAIGDYDADRYAHVEETLKLGVLLDNLAATLLRAEALSAQ